MILPCRNIWDIKIQCVCGILSAFNGSDIELFLSANFGQVSLDPPRLIVNPNRLYPIETAILRERRFAVNVLSSSQRELALRMLRLRRRAPAKAKLLNFPLFTDSQHRIPYLDDCLRTIFCEVEDSLESGDHRIIIARVLESRGNAEYLGTLPLLYPEISGTPARYPPLSRIVRMVMNKTGAKQVLYKFLEARHGVEPNDIAKNTYEHGGQTESEVLQIQSYGLVDQGRSIVPPSRAPAILKKRIGVCVVGVGNWGSYHCKIFREASSNVDLYVCGRNPDRLAKVGRSVGAKGSIIGYERVVEDSRIQALSIVLPHHMHCHVTKLAAQAGKHVLVEKPIATSLVDADEMINSAAAAGIVFMVAEDVHFRPAVREAVLAIDREGLGEPMYMLARAGGVVRPSGWKANREHAGGGILMDLGVHYIRAMRLLMGEPDGVLATRSMQINTKMSGEDSVQLLFSSRYGWQAHILLNWSSPREYGPDITINCEKATLQLWPGESFYDVWPASQTTTEALLAYVRPEWLARRLRFPTLRRKRIRVPDKDKQGYITEIREFLAAISEERTPVSSPHDARRDLELVLRAYDSLAQQTWVSIGREK